MWPMMTSAPRSFSQVGKGLIKASCPSQLSHANPFHLPLITVVDFQSNNELGRSVATEYQTAARQSGRLFLPIYLSCDVAENLRRVGSLERVNSGTKRLLSGPVLQDIRSRCELFRFDIPEGFDINVTRLLPTEAATEILAYVGSRVRENEREI
jgi:hypothetical protein